MVVFVSVPSLSQIDMFKNYSYLIGLVSLFNGISILLGYLMPKPSVYKNSGSTILPIARMIRGVPKGICLKVNVIAQLEFELAHYNSAAQSLTITPRGHQHS